MVKEEKRKIKQIEVLDDDGNLEYTIIPNYRVREHFMTNNELRFYKLLIKVVIELKAKYNINLTIFSQVAVNRIIDVNNERKKDELFYKICSKSIDFVLYDENSNDIYCCIELDDSSHQLEERQKRDILIDKVFKDNIRLLHIKSEKYYDFDSIVNLIKN